MGKWREEMLKVSFKFIPFRSMFLFNFADDVCSPIVSLFQASTCNIIYNGLDVFSVVTGGGSRNVSFRAAVTTV